MNLQHGWNLIPTSHLYIYIHIDACVQVTSTQLCKLPITKSIISNKLTNQEN